MSDLSWAEVARRFEEARNWWVHTSGASGPHVVPVWGVVLDEVLTFYGDPATVRSRNLAADPRLVLHLEDGEAPLIVHGVVAVRGRAGARSDLVGAYECKYQGQYDRDYLLDSSYAGAALAFEVVPSKAMAWKVTTPEAWEIRRWEAPGDR